jgi:2-keto-4-pentenoate hydratase
MNRESIDLAVGHLVEAYQLGVALAGWPEGCQPKTPREAYQIQDALTRELGIPIGGWKIGATTAEARRMLKARGPFSGRVLAPRIFASGVSLPSSAYRMRGVECEFAFRLARDLAPRARPYAPKEVLAAVDTLHPAIEIVETRFRDWATAGGLCGIIADQGSNGGLVLGRPIKDWRKLDLAAAKVALSVNGQRQAEGTGALVMGDPVKALTWLANHRRRAGGLKAGQVITTGTCTGLYRGAPGDEAVGRFANGSKVAVKFL